MADDYAGGLVDGDYVIPMKRRRRGSWLRTTRGRVILSIFVFFLAVGCAGMIYVAYGALMHDGHFMLRSASSIEVQGIDQVTRDQVLDVFAGDLEHNIFTVPLAERRSALEQLPWIEHATVMRLLPNRLRVQIVERVPVAFASVGGHVSLIDANGVLLDVPSDAESRYSFPVITGFSADDPISLRAARMSIYQRFSAEMAAGGADVLKKNVSDVDLSNPEDICAHVEPGGVLLHFGQDRFLERYQLFAKNLPQFEMQCPQLTSVDMSYEVHPVLDKQPGGCGSDLASASTTAPVSNASAPVRAQAAHPKPPARSTKTAKKETSLSNPSHRSRP